MVEFLEHALRNLSKSESKSVAIIVKRYCKTHNDNISKYILQERNCAFLLLENLPDLLIKDIISLIE